MSERSISVILPVHNQADHVYQVVKGYLEVFKKIPAQIEVILVPNACLDNSIEECKKLAHEDNNIKLVEIEKSGWGRAVIAGVKASGGEVICYTNLARTQSKDLLLLLLYSLANENVVVKANRKIRESLFRRSGSLLYNLEARSLFDFATWDINGTPKLFCRCHSELFNLTSEDDLIDLEFIVICKKFDYQILEVPILSVKRQGGRSTTGIKTALRLYSGAFRIKKKYDE